MLADLLLSTSLIVTPIHPDEAGMNGLLLRVPLAVFERERQMDCVTNGANLSGFLSS
jgi:hypothetical protein